ncbi:ABC transporter permease [Candidatus Omnitrophota bacterium]
MKTSFKRYANLVREFTVAGFKLKDHGSFLGLMWTVVYPLVMLLILYMLFSKRLGRGIEHYQIYLLIGIIHWNFFSKGTTVGLSSLMDKKAILRSARLPKTAVVASSIVEVFTLFLIELLILGIFMFFSGVGFSKTFAFLPLIILIELLLIIGVSLTLSCLNVYFRDIAHIWNILLRFGFFLTPIFYPIPMFISQGKHGFYLLNPMTQIIIFARDALLLRKFPSLFNMFLVFVFAVCVTAIGYTIFKKSEYSIVERL